MRATGTASWLALLAYINANLGAAFVPLRPPMRPTASVSAQVVSRRHHHASRHPIMSPTTTQLYSRESDEQKDAEIEKLRSMAAKLRAEVSQLEAQRANDLAMAAEKVFTRFDTNQDGQISLTELKNGLEKQLKVDLPDQRVAQLMTDFDKSGDGVLQLAEMVTVEQFRARLEALARQEKDQALRKQKEAQQEQEMSKFLQAQLDMINDGPASVTDRVVSALPYLFPLLDGLQFARFLVLENQDNPVAQAVTVAYALYRSIPLGGFIAFLALSVLSGNLRINRLVRFNMQQAIFLDIALFFPGLLAALYQLVGGGLPPQVTELGSDVLLGALLVSVSYCMLSSLLGIVPDRLPLISDAVNARTPTVDMFDSQGRLKDRKQRRDADNNDDDQKDDKK